MHPDTNNIDDEVLVRRCRHGDTDAMGQLIRRYEERIFNTILRICQNKDDAAELTQDTFVKVIENIEKFKGRSAFYTWLFRVAVNLTYNHCKRTAKLSSRSLEQDIEGLTQTGVQLSRFLTDDKEQDPAVLAQDNEIQRLAMAALGRLDEEQRVIVVLRDIEGLSYERIAEVLEIELGTVKSRLSRARVNLAKILKRDTL